MPRIPVRKIARRAVHIDPNVNIQEAAKILIHNRVREALVDESSLGLVSMTEITWAVADGRADLKVRDIMTRDFLTIDSKELIFEAVKVLGRSGAKRLVVLDSGNPWGVIAPEDLIGALTPN